MIWFILAIVALVVGAALMFVPELEARVAGGVLIFVALVVAVMSCLTIVGTRNVGVVTTFGKPTGRTLANGLHFKAPWQKVTDIDGTIDTQKFVGTDHCIDVRIADGSTACVSVVIRTRVDQDHADDIYADYRNSDRDINDNVNDALVRTQLTSALASTFSTFDPLLVPGSVANSASTDQAAPDLQKFSTSVLEQMESRLRDQSNDDKPEVDVTGLTLSFIRLSDSTQARLNQLQAEVAKTRIAKQQQATATATASANQNLRESLTTEVLTAKCLDILETRTDKELSIPAAFSCFGASTASVVVGAK